MVTRKQVEFEGQQLVMETGKLAKQASGAAWVQLGDTVVPVAVTADIKPSEERDFFPLTVDYREKAYAAGRSPAAFSNARASQLMAKFSMPVSSTAAFVRFLPRLSATRFRSSSMRSPQTR